MYITRSCILLLLIVLAGCSLPGTQTESVDVIGNTMTFEGNGITILVPKAWS